MHLALVGRAFYFRGMKWILMLNMTAWLGCVSILRAQDASTVADRQAVEERFQQLSGKFQDLQESQQAQAKRIEVLAAEIRSFREEINKPDTDKVQREEVRRLAEQLKDVDEKRAADKELILKAISKLANAPVSPAGKTAKLSAAKPKAEPQPDVAGADAVSAAEKNYEGYEHVVKSDETLSAIVRAYNKEQGLKLTVEQVLKHPLNANVKPEKLRVGQKVFIPAK